jgi:hypothetical protein
MMTKNIISKFLLSIVASTTITAHASDVSSYLAKKTDKQFDSIIQKAYKSDSGRDSVYSDIQSSVNSESSPQAVSNANELLINVTSMVFPQFSGYWDNVATWSNVPIYQNHDLYDMERQSLPKDSKMGLDKVSIPDHKGNFAFADGNRVSTTPYGTTEFLMSRGYPGVGPDGMPIQLCRFFSSKYAPYVEISYSDAKALFPIIRGARYEVSCLSANLSYDYWKSRKNDFFNNFGDIVKPPVTLQHF